MVNHVCLLLCDSFQLNEAPHFLQLRTIGTSSLYCPKRFFSLKGSKSEGSSGRVTDKASQIFTSTSKGVFIEATGENKFVLVAEPIKRAANDPTI